MTETQEILKAIESANGGYWLPITIIGGGATMILGLLLFIYNLHLKTSNGKHKASEDTQKELKENLVELRILSQKYDTKLESHQGQINENRRNIKEAG